MIDVGRNNGAPGSHFVTHKFRRDVLRQARAEAFAGMLLAQDGTADTFAAHVFTDGDKLHFRGHDALTGVVQLRNALARFGAERG